MLFLTDFADEAVVLPLVGAVLCGLLAGGWRRGAVGWAAVCAATLGGVAVAKLGLFLWGPAGALASPSGHTAAAPLVYGGLAGVLGPERWRRLWLGLAAVAGALVIGATRLALQVHSVADVAAGAAAGLVGVAVLAVAMGPRPEGFRPWAVLALALAAIAGFHGLRLPVEQWLHVVAGK